MLGPFLSFRVPLLLSIFWKVDKLLTHKTFYSLALTLARTRSRAHTFHIHFHIQTELYVSPHIFSLCVSLINIKNVQAQAFCAQKKWSMEWEREREKGSVRWEDRHIVKITSLDSECVCIRWTSLLPLRALSPATPTRLNSNNIKINSFPFIVLTFDVSVLCACSCVHTHTQRLVHFVLNLIVVAGV